jgi:DNA-binding transcriptional MocR family regulator
MGSDGKTPMSDSKQKTIFETLKAAIADGRYGASAPMPSERALMKKFGVSRSTIASVMRELARAGLVQRRLGSGTYPVIKKPITFAVILPDTEKPFHAAICSGLANCAKNQGGGRLFAVMGERRHSFLFRSLLGRENRRCILRAA